MKALLLILLAATINIIACIQPNKSSKQQQKTPKALEDKNTSFEIASKRGYDDLVESLYTELTEKNAELKKFEAAIDGLEKSQNDSSASFVNYNAKNQSYFHAVDRHIEQIKDSVLREKIKSVIAESFTRYNTLLTSNNRLFKYIQQKNIELTDLHTILKITKTLPLIEKYQADNLPDTNSLKGAAIQVDETIKQINTISTH